MRKIVILDGYAGNPGDLSWEPMKALAPCDIYDFGTADTVLERIGAKRGMKMRGGDVDTERAAITLLDEYRAGKLGRLSIETPELDG